MSRTSSSFLSPCLSFPCPSSQHLLQPLDVSWPFGDRGLDGRSFNTLDLACEFLFGAGPDGTDDYQDDDDVLGSDTLYTVDEAGDVIRVTMGLVTEAVHAFVHLARVGVLPVAVRATTEALLNAADRAGNRDGVATWPEVLLLSS